MTYYFRFLGPLGLNTWNPADMMKVIGNWEQFKKLVMNNTGPLDVPNGPMSSEGPLGDSFWTVMPTINDFTKHMMGHGIWSVLGPIGPLGALGGLGPLGPVGAHGYGRNDQGQYVNSKGQIMRKVMAMYTSGKWVEWPLFEFYNASFARLMNYEDADTSFMVKATGNATFRATSREQQFVTIAVVPVFYSHVFTIAITEAEHPEHVIASSNSIQFINWIQMHIPKGDFPVSFDIVIQSNSVFTSNPFVSSDYYLYVVGSTQWMLRKPHITFSGDYISHDCLKKRK